MNFFFKYEITYLYSMSQKKYFNKTLIFEMKSLYK